MLFGCTALIIEGVHALSSSVEVGQDKPDTRIEFASMPLDLGNDATNLGPTRGPIAEVRVIPPHVLGRPADRALQEVGDIAL